MATASLKFSAKKTIPPIRKAKNITPAASLLCMLDTGFV